MKHGRDAAHVDHQLDLPGLGLVANQGDDVADHTLDFEVGEFQFQLAGLDLRQIENVVDEIEQVVGGSGDLGQPVGVAHVGDLAAEQVGEADDGVHRGADFVTHVGQKLALAAAGRLGRLHRDDHFGAALGYQLLKVVPVVRQLLADAFLLGDVVLDGNVMGDAAVGLAQRRDAHGLGALLAGAHAVHELTAPDAAGAELGPQGRVGFRRRLARLEHAGIAADDLLAGVTALLHEGIVNVFDAAAQIGDDHRGRCLLDHQRELAQRPLRGFTRPCGTTKGEHRLGHAAQHAARILADGFNQRHRGRVHITVGERLQRGGDAGQTPRRPGHEREPAGHQRRHQHAADHRDAHSVLLEEPGLAFAPRGGSGGNGRSNGVGVLGEGHITAGGLVGMPHAAPRIDGGKIGSRDDEVAIGLEIGHDRGALPALVNRGLQRRHVLGQPGKAVDHLGMHPVNLAFVQLAGGRLFKRRRDPPLNGGDFLVKTGSQPDSRHLIDLQQAGLAVRLAQALQGTQVEHARKHHDYRHRNKENQLKAQQAGRVFCHPGCGLQRRSSGHWAGATLATYSKPAAPMGRNTTSVASRGK